MFKKRFKLLHEKIYFYSYLITFVSLFLPWLRMLHVFIPGIILPFGVVTVILLTISAGLNYISKRKKEVPSISNIIIGILCLVTTVGHLIGYGSLIDSIGAVGGYSFGVYIAIIGSIGILASGILGVKYKKNNNIN